MSNKSSIYNPRVVKTQGIIRHYGWLNREQGPKMDLKFVGESWNLVQRRLHGMEGRGGSVREGQHPNGNILWGAMKGACRAFQSGSCVYGEQAISYPYRGVDVYLPRFQAPPFPWAPFPPPMVYRCRDLWELNPGLVDLQNSTNALTQIYPAVATPPIECWKMTCGNLWAMHPAHDDDRTLANENLVVWPEGLAEGNAGDCWDSGQPDDVPGGPPVDPSPDCDDFYDITIAYCNRQPEPYKSQCKAQTEMMKELGNWSYPDCWGILPPRIPLHKYLLEVEAETVIDVYESRKNTDLPTSVEHVVVKEQSESINAYDWSMKDSTHLDRRLYRGMGDSYLFRLHDRIFETSGKAAAVVEDGVEIGGGKRNGLAKLDLTEITYEPAYKPAVGFSFTWPDTRPISHMDLTYHIGLPKFSHAAVVGDEYLVSHRIDGLNRYDQEKQVEVRKLIRVRLRPDSELNIEYRVKSFVTGRTATSPYGDANVAPLVYHDGIQIFALSNFVTSFGPWTFPVGVPRYTENRIEETESSSPRPWGHRYYNTGKYYSHDSGWVWCIAFVIYNEVRYLMFRKEGPGGPLQFMYKAGSEWGFAGTTLTAETGFWCGAETTKVES